MAYDVFISYSSRDRAWAAQIAADLHQRGVNCFFDQKSLRDGEGWEGQIRADLMASSHVICLWSKWAKDSVWVGRELALFDVLHPMGCEDGGLLLKVNLDDTASAYASRQLIRDTAVVAAYAADQTPWPGAAWTDLVRRLRHAVKQERHLVTVPVAVLTLTQPEVAAIPSAALQRIADRLELDAAALAARYGAQRNDWKPFIDSASSIGELLGEVKLEIDQRLDPRSVFFDLPDDAFWDSHDVAQTWVTGMKQRAIGAVIIDPVALSSVDVQTRLALFAQLVALDNVSIIALHPQQATARATKFRLWIKEFATSVMQPYFDPPLVAESLYAVRCGIGLDDAVEVRRLVQASIGQLLRKAGPSSTPASPIVAT